MGWDSHLFNNSQFIVIHAVKAFSVNNEAEVDVFLELSEVPEQASDPSPGESKGGGVAGQTISLGQSPRLPLHKTEMWLPRTSGSRKNGTQADATVQEQFRPWAVSESSRGFQNVGTKTESCKCCLRPLGEEESE